MPIGASLKAPIPVAGRDEGTAEIQNTPANAK